MKKILYLLFALIIFILSACGNNTVAIDGNYYTMDAIYRSFNNAEELVEISEVVLVGKVSGISFEVLNSENGLPPTEKTDERRRKLYTIYDIDIVEVYKGNVVQSTRVKIDGGLRDYRVEEQMKLIKNMNAWPNDGIVIQEGVPDIKIGEMYLFVLCLSKSGICTNMNPVQSIYNLNNPFEKPYDYFAAKDVISVFGEDKWETFWTQWQKDNPNWETWLDKETVETELAK